MRIQHNIMAMNAHRNYANSTSALSKNLEKLSSGYKINRVGGDAADLAIFEKMRAQITGLDKTRDNAKDGILLVQIIEGALTEVHDIFSRIYELARQSVSSTFEDGTDREQPQKEVDQLKNEVSRIADSVDSNGIKLPNSFTTVSGTTKIITATSSTKIGVDVSIAMDSLFDRDGNRSRLKLSSAVVSTGKKGVVTRENGVTISLEKRKDYSVAGIQALLTKVKTSGTGVAEDMMKSVQNAAITDVDVTSGPKPWTILAKASAGVAQANQGKLLTPRISDTFGSLDQLRADIKDCHIDVLGLTDMKIGDQTNAAAALDKIKSTVNYVSGVCGTLSAIQNHLDYTASNPSVMQENIRDAESTIRDTDVADEMMAYTKNSILIRSAQTALAQVNQVSQGVLQLLQ